MRCHSEMSRAIVALVERPIAYRHTSGPNGVTQVATAEASRMTSIVRRPGRRRTRSSSAARPMASGARKKLPCRFAQASTTSGSSQMSAGRRSRAGQDRHDGDEADDAEQLRPEGQRADPQQEAGQRQVARPERRSRPAPAAHEHESRRPGRSGAPAAGRARPSPQAPWTRATKTPVAPLLVEPGLPERGEGEGIRAQHGTEPASAPRPAPGRRGPRWASGRSSPRRPAGGPRGRARVGRGSTRRLPSTTQPVLVGR